METIAACLNEDLGQTLLDALEINILRRRDDDGAHIRIYFAALQNFSCNAHVINTAVGAGADDRLLDFDVAVSSSMVLVFSGRCGHAIGRTERGQVDLDGLLVLGIGIGLKCGNVAVVRGP